MKEYTASRLDMLLSSHPLPSWRPLAWPIMGLVLVFAVWATFAQLDEVAVAIGEVVPQGKVKVIQHLEGGIIEAIHVTEGMRVTQGQSLVQLDLASAGANKAELEVRLDSQVLVRTRLLAEAEGNTPRFASELAKRRPEQVAAEINNFEARKDQLASKLSVLQEQVRQRQLEMQELESRQKTVNRNFNLAKERLQMSASLLEQGLTARMEHLQLEAEVESLEGEVQGLRSAIPKAMATIAEARQRVAEEEGTFRREARDELAKTEQAIGRISELLAEATGQEVRAEIKSPIDGVVQNMRYHTIGGVVTPGEPIMEIVPTGENLVVEARLRPVDRGYVAEGQPAVVKVTTYDFARYGGLDGNVIMVAPDSSTDEQGNPYFRVVVQTDKTHLGEAEGLLPIMPGMEATVDIHTGRKSVAEYLVKPVLKLRHEAFRER